MSLRSSYLVVCLIALLKSTEASTATVRKGLTYSSTVTRPSYLDRGHLRA